MAILNFSLLKEEASCYNKYRFMNVESGKQLSDITEIAYFELDKFLKKKMPIKDMTNRELWGLFLTTEREEDLKMLSSKEKVFEKAVEKLVYVSADDKLRYEYDMREKAERDYYNAMMVAEERGITEGMERGIKKGIEKGMAEGVEKAKLIAAANLKKEGFDNETIARITELPLEKVETLPCSEYENK